MRAYFLVAKDVGDLTRIFCAALEAQNKKRRATLANILPGFLKLRGKNDDFFVETARLNARPGAFKSDPVNLIRIFHIADAKSIDIHPDALRTITRSLDLVDDALRANPVANKLFLEILSSRSDPERVLRLMNEAGVLRPVRARVRPRRRPDAVQHVPPLHGGRASDPRGRQRGVDRTRRIQGRASAVPAI